MAGFFSPSMDVVKNQQDQVLSLIKEKISADIEKEEELATYKIEVAFSWDRKSSEPSPGIMMIWKSGKKIHGGGDDKMFWCGYSDCYKPIESKKVQGAIAFCESCSRPQFATGDDKEQVIALAKLVGQPHIHLMERPSLSSEKFFKLSPAKLAGLIERVWRDLYCNADIYMKFFKKKIRYNKDEKAVVVADILSKARLNREYVVYPLRSILRDTADGSSVKNTILAFLKA